MVKRRTYSRGRKTKRKRSSSRTRSRSRDPFKSSFKKRRVSRPKLAPTKKSRVSKRKSKKTPTVTWKRVPRDTRPGTGGKKKTSATATSLPTTHEGIVKKFRPDLSAKQVATKKKSSVKKFFADTKKFGKTIAKGIEDTAKTAEKASQFIEPWLNAAALRYPQLAPAAAANTAVAEITKQIDHTADTAARGKDAYAQLTDTKKYQKMTSEFPPKVNLIENDPRWVSDNNFGYTVNPPQGSKTSMMEID